MNQWILSIFGQNHMGIHKMARSTQASREVCFMSGQGGENPRGKNAQHICSHLQ